jgi:hypothetical protein
LGWRALSGLGFSTVSGWPRDQSPAAIAERQANVNRVVAAIAAMPILDPRSPNEIMNDINAL